MKFTPQRITFLHSIDGVNYSLDFWEYKMHHIYLDTLPLMFTMLNSRSHKFFEIYEGVRKKKGRMIKINDKDFTILLHFFPHSFIKGGHQAYSIHVFLQGTGHTFTLQYDTNRYSTHEESKNIKII